MGSIMSNEPELRSKAKEIGPLAGKIVAKVNALSPEEQEAEMEKLGVEVETKKPKAKEKGLQELPGTHENIVLRFAPNPSGPLHIGHSRAAVPNAEYVKRHNGKLILRIEDTDPKRVFEPAYEMTQSLPASESFPMSQLFSRGGQSTGVSVSPPQTGTLCLLSKSTW